MGIKFIYGHFTQSKEKFTEIKLKSSNLETKKKLFNWNKFIIKKTSLYRSSPKETSIALNL